MKEIIFESLDSCWENEPLTLLLSNKKILNDIRSCTGELENCNDKEACEYIQQWKNIKDI